MKVKVIVQHVLILLSCCSLAFAQQGSILYEVCRGRSIVASPPNENGYPNEYEIETGTLYFSGDFSIYQQIKSKTLMKIEIGPDGAVDKTEFPREHWDSTGRVYIKDIPRQQLRSREALWNSKTYLQIEDALPRIAWKLSQETKTIGGYRCQKATATFRGREWEAWYAPEIALPIGPWKLWGLPGAILEARDSTLDFVFKLKALQIPAEVAPARLDPATYLRDDAFISMEEYHARNERSKDKQRQHVHTIAIEYGGAMTVNFPPQLEVVDP